MDKQIDLFKTFLYNCTDFIKSNKNKNKNKNTFIYDSNEPLKAGVIPDGTTELIFGDSFNQPLEKGIIPNSVTRVTLGKNFNQPLEEGIIPNSVTYIIFGWYFNKRLKKGDIPNSVTHIIFGFNFNHLLEEGIIPNGVTHIMFGSCFNQLFKKGVIPNSVTHLMFGWRFDQPLYNIISKNIICLILFEEYPYKNSFKNNNTLLCYYTINCYMKYNKISLKNMIQIYEYINDNLTEDKLIGKVIFKELTEKVLHPNRLMKICNEYKVDFADLLCNYIKN